MTEFLICSFSNSKTFDYICGHRVNDKTYKVLNLQSSSLKFWEFPTVPQVILHESSCKTGT